MKQKLLNIDLYLFFIGIFSCNKQRNKIKMYILYNFIWQHINIRSIQIFYRLDNNNRMSEINSHKQ